MVIKNGDQNHYDIFNYTLLHKMELNIRLINSENNGIFFFSLKKIFKKIVCLKVHIITSRLLSAGRIAKINIQCYV